MKKIVRNLLLLLMVCMSITLSSQGQAIENPGEYMTAISKARGDMDVKYMQYLSAAAHGRKARKVEKLRAEVIETINQCKYKTTDLPKYKGDNSLRQGSIDYITLCYRVFNEDYKKIVDMEEVAEQSFDAMSAYLLLQDKVSEKLNEGSNQLHKTAMDFAAKYNVRIDSTQNALSNKLDLAGKLNNYTNSVFLIFFKCNWQDMEMVTAMNNKKVNDVEQSRNSLLRFATDGLKGLDTLKSFNGDPSLANACRDVLKYYKKMAEADVPKLTDFYLKEENFTKTKKSFEAKPTSSRTKEDVDGFNKTVNEYNEAVNNFNKTNNTMNKERTQTMNTWEAVQKKFADANMPYYKG
ncbi:hypothetical protein A4D02_01530 [Niastella koreensis]|uniref:Uncharacterized protein n=2 Tax=Niastella koreensis TaxID=354356 RepID=G8TF59_NIAKG|nr:hypothetical protein [Niastella koreensis]AEW02679.1 hypothetical protein Niako_6455 [Niastella koreensis GR20-10]OQP55029.1 hypothetical protein A4D02_01530 [Niastella koreensis]